MTLRNWEVVVYALYLLEGEIRAVHTEDIALKSYELAPDCFSWIKHPKYPDKDITRVALTDARKGKMGSLISGRTGRGKGQSKEDSQQRSPDGWRLEANGIKWIKENEERLRTELGQRQPKVHRQETLGRLSRIREHPLFKEYLDRRDNFVPSIGHLAELLRCRVDADQLVWDKRFDAIKKMALVTQQEDVLGFIGLCQDFVASNLGRERS